MDNAQIIEQVAGGIGMVGRNVIKTMDGRKAQTRRVEACLRNLPDCIEHAVKMVDDSGETYFNMSGGPAGVGLVEYVTPRYQPGKAYYVKEALEKVHPSSELYGPTAAYKCDRIDVVFPIGHPCEGDVRPWMRDDGTPWKPNVIPAIYMPKSAARTFIKITDVRCERLHDIRLDDIIAEGCQVPAEPVEDLAIRADLAWRRLWNESNGKNAWPTNPWVFAYEFELVQLSP